MQMGMQTAEAVKPTFQTNALGGNSVESPTTTVQVLEITISQRLLHDLDWSKASGWLQDQTEQPDNKLQAYQRKLPELDEQTTVWVDG